jgi:hypothetical protein
LGYVRVYNQNVYYIGSSSIKRTEVVEYNFETNTRHMLRRSAILTIDQRYISVPELIKFKIVNDIAYEFLLSI